MTEVVRLLSEDAERMAELHAACFDTPWNEQDFRNLLALPGALALGVAESGNLVSLILSSLIVGQADIVTVATQPTARRKGHGRTLLQEWLSASVALGVERATLDVAADNDGAIGLYEAFGFTPDGRRSNYYRRADGTKADAILYSLKLDASAGLGAAPTA